MTVKLLSIKTLKLIDEIYEALLSKNYLYDCSCSLTHNDFSSDNMIFRNKRLAGVIDFGDFVVGDPDNDFLCLLDISNDDFGKDFGRRVLKYYGHKYPDVAERKAELNDLYYPCQQIIYGFKRKNRIQLLRGFNSLKSIDTNKFID